VSSGGARTELLPLLLLLEEGQVGSADHLLSIASLRAYDNSSYLFSVLLKTVCPEPV
jgi:hypothetical protein